MTRTELLQNAKPILFNTEMVRAILDDKKTVTRRVIKPQPCTDCDHGGNHEFVSDDFGGECEYTGFVCRKCGYGVSPPHCKYPCGSSFFRPHYNSGDILYVRETWSEHYTAESDGELVYCYKADGIDLNAECLPGENNRWWPSIHMPKEAARIFLRVTDVRVEKLNEISFDDIMAEGVGIMPEAFNDPDNAYLQAVEAFEKVWNGTIKKSDLDRYGWAANPWVWVVDFEKLEVDI